MRMFACDKYAPNSTQQACNWNGLGFHLSPAHVERIIFNARTSLRSS